MAKWVNPDNSLPEHGKSVLVQKAGGEYLKMEYNGSVSEWWKQYILRWLDESKDNTPSFSLKQMIACWDNSMSTTIENTSYDKIDGCIDPDYSFMQKEKIEYFKKQYNIDL